MVNIDCIGSRYYAYNIYIDLSNHPMHITRVWSDNHMLEQFKPKQIGVIYAIVLLISHKSQKNLRWSRQQYVTFNECLWNGLTWVNGPYATYQKAIIGGPCCYVTPFAAHNSLLFALHGSIIPTSDSPGKTTCITTCCKVTSPRARQVTRCCLGRIFNRNSNNHSCCSLQRFSAVIAMKFCTFHDSYAVVACANLCRNMIPYTLHPNFPSYLNYNGKSLVKLAPGQLARTFTDSILTSLCNPRDHCTHSLCQNCYTVQLITSNLPTYLHMGTTLWLGVVLYALVPETMHGIIVGKRVRTRQLSDRYCTCVWMSGMFWCDQ